MDTERASLAAHPGERELLDYWFADADAAATEAMDAHLLGCDACGERLDRLAALGSAVRGAVDAGAVAAFVGAPFIERLKARGRRVREYRVPHNGGVNCTVAPQDDLLAGRMQLPAGALRGIARLDAEAEFSTGRETLRLADIPFDAHAAEVVMLPPLAQVRLMPAHVMRVRLLAMEPQGTREIGHFTFRHTPWNAG